MELQNLYNTYGAATIHFKIVDRSEEQFHAEKLKEIQEELKARRALNLLKLSRVHSVMKKHLYPEFRIKMFLFINV